MRSTSVVPALLVLGLLVGAAGCNDVAAEDSGPAAPTVSATGAPTGTGVVVPETSAPPFTADTRPDDGGYGSGSALGVTGVRTARHPGYDRVVFDLGGTGTPGWRADYTTSPLYEGSGDPVELEGTTFLMLFIRGVGLPYDTGLAPYGDVTTRVPGTDTKGIAEIAPGGVFEGEQQVLIGLTGSERPFRVFALSDPARLVVDVTHEDLS